MSSKEVAVHRLEVPFGGYFWAPRNLTFGYQPERKAFSVWFLSSDKPDCFYTMTGTGHPLPISATRVVGSCVLPDGYTMVHVVRLLQAVDPHPDVAVVIGKEGS